jgi:Beta-lactamase enzyme family
MRTRGLTCAAAVLAVGMLTLGAGVTAVAMTKPAVRAAVPGTRGGRKSARVATAEAAEVIAADVRVTEGICTAPPREETLAAPLSTDIQAALRGRAGRHAVTVYDAVTGVSCQANSTLHFDSASIVKAIILAALLRWHQETGTRLSAWEQDEATLMITQSDNDAATALWNEVGMSRLQHFLNLAKMTETGLGQDGYWGLTQATAHDEMLLLELLTRPNSVLSPASRAYQLRLMAGVIPAQRWGTPAGAPGDVTVHVKNGWLPDGTGWHVNSLGAFTGKGKNYLIAVLTDGNASEQYGIDTIESVARAVHRDLNAAGAAAAARFAANVASAPTPTGTPSSWAVVPALPAPPQPPR